MKHIMIVMATLLCIIMLPLPLISQTEDDVVINEFVVNPATGKEYIEFLVTVATPANMQGWTISDVGTRVGTTGATEGDITLPASATYLASVPRGTYIVIELTTPVANTSTLTEDTSLSDASPRRLIIKTTTSGVTTAGTTDMSTNENIHLYAGTRAAGTLIDQVCNGTNSSYVAGTTWGDNSGATTTDNVNGGTSIPSLSAVQFVPTDQTSPAGFQDNDTGTKFAVDDSSYGTPGTTNTGVDDSGGGLPVQIASFSGTTVNGNDVMLEWTTVSEVNNYGFYVERRTEGNEFFSTVSELIYGAGTTLEEQHYSWSETGLAPGNYDYRLRQVDLDGLEHYTSPVTVRIEQALAVDDRERPNVFALQQNYPNPFNPLTSISYQLPAAGFVTLTVYNVLGSEIAVLVNEVKQAGAYQAKWDAANVSSGLYFYRLQAGNFSSVKKMVLLK